MRCLFGQFKQTGLEDQRRPAFHARASSASWAGFSDCAFQTKHPSRNTGDSRRTGNCSGACGVAVLVTEGREGIRLPAGGTWVNSSHADLDHAGPGIRFAGNQRPSCPQALRRSPGQSCGHQATSFMRWAGPLFCPNKPAVTQSLSRHQLCVGSNDPSQRKRDGPSGQTGVFSEEDCCCLSSQTRFHL